MDSRMGAQELFWMWWQRANYDCAKNHILTCHCLSLFSNILFSSSMPGSFADKKLAIMSSECNLLYSFVWHGGMGCCSQCRNEHTLWEMGSLAEVTSNVPKVKSTASNYFVCFNFWLRHMKGYFSWVLVKWLRCLHVNADGNIYWKIVMIF